MNETRKQNINRHFFSFFGKQCVKWGEGIRGGGKDAHALVDAEDLESGQVSQIRLQYLPVIPILFRIALDPSELLFKAAWYNKLWRAGTVSLWIPLIDSNIYILREIFIAWINIFSGSLASMKVMMVRNGKMRATLISGYIISKKSRVFRTIFGTVSSASNHALKTYTFELPKLKRDSLKAYIFQKKHRTLNVNLLETCF